MFNSKDGVKDALSSKNEVVPTKESQGHDPQGRPARVPLAQQAKLSIPKGLEDPNYAYRFIIDKPERVEAFVAAWWEPAKDGTGKPIKKPAGNGLTLVLYRTPREYFEEDLREKQKKPIDLLEESAKLDKGNQYSSEYVPQGQQSVVTIKH